MNSSLSVRSLGSFTLVFALLLGLTGCQTSRGSSSDEVVSIRAEVVGYGPVTLRDGTIAQASRLRIISPAALAINPRYLQVDLISDGGAPASHDRLRQIGKYVDFELSRAATSPVAFEVIPWSEVTVTGS